MATSGAIDGSVSPKSRATTTLIIADDRSALSPRASGRIAAVAFLRNAA